MGHFGLMGKMGLPAMAVAWFLNLKGSHVYRTSALHETHHPERVEC